MGLCLALGACRSEPLPQPVTGPPRLRPSGLVCDYLAEFPPPPARIEVVDPAAHRDDGCVWLDGHWQWGVRRWSWVPGNWVRIPSGCHLAPGMSRWQAGPGGSSNLCVRYPELVTGADGSRCLALPCTPPAAPPSPRDPHRYSGPR